MRKIAFVFAPLLVLACGEATSGGGNAGSTGGASSTTNVSSTTSSTSSGTSGAAGSATSGTSASTGSSSTTSGAGTAGSAGASGAGGNGGAAGSTGAGGKPMDGGAGAAMTDAGANGLQATQVNGGYFPPGAPWYQDVSGSNAKVASDSADITGWMESKAPPNGFGGALMNQQHGYFTVDLSIVTIDVPAGTPKRTYQTVDAFHASPDCDTAPIPVPMGGAVEGYMGPLAGFSGYHCSSFDPDGDCHMLFLSRSENRLYETYHSTIVGNTFSVGCLALWDTSKVYDAHGRGDQCTSADAAGYPMAPLLFTAEEIAAGSINHAIRFALPNDMLRAKVYVSPATHGTNTTGPATSLPYGARMRLKTPYPGMSALSPAAQVVARALQKYGMFHADGGNVPLMGQSDVLSKVKYAAVGFDTHALTALKATDFEVVEYATPIPVTFDCKRTPITQ
jgi:hypothetical protein